MDDNIILVDEALKQPGKKAKQTKEKKTIKSIFGKINSKKGKSKKEKIEKTKSSGKHKKNKKAVAAVITAIAFAAGSVAYGIAGLAGLFKRNNDKSETSTSQTTAIDSTMTDVPTTTSIEKELETNSLDKLGVELEFPKEEKKEYNNPTGDVDANKIVKDSDGDLWVDQDAASKKDEIGEEVIDDKNGDLEVKPNGDVYVPEVGYEIKDDNGNVVATGDVGDNGLPDGYEYDEDTGVIMDDEHANTGLYIAPDGSVWESKEVYDEYIEALNQGEIIVSESTPTEPITTTTESTPTEPITTTTEPTVTEDGYYTDPETGLVFESKEDYEQWVLQGYEGYIIVDGIMVPIPPEINPNNNVKTYTR